MLEYLSFVGYLSLSGCQLLHYLNLLLQDGCTISFCGQDMAILQLIPLYTAYSAPSSERLCSKKSAAVEIVSWFAIQIKMEKNVHVVENEKLCKYKLNTQMITTIINLKFRFTKELLITQLKIYIIYICIYTYHMNMCIWSNIIICIQV